MGTDDRVYGGDCDLVHVADGRRRMAGYLVANHIETHMRENAENRTEREKEMQALCPGCYMIVAFNALVWLAGANKQTPKELGLTMAQAFLKLAECDSFSEACIEEIEVILDPEADACRV
jgi:hypothetical protein